MPKKKSRVSISWLRTRKHLDQVTQFFVHLRCALDSLPDLSSHDFAEPLSQPVNRDFYGTFVQAELPRDIGLR